ncbi:UNVERIFIED_CONTAM: hypothetical protein Sradi_7032900 [Sesamum radiatum]|uniref:Uncharacterized protein n=1 Tax=Sesamum radiatum TaxID=300843 RepID=A0AAW2J9W9_SESRA
MLEEKKGKGKAVAITTCAPNALVLPVGMGNGKGKAQISQLSKTNDICMHFQEKGHWKRKYTQILFNQDMFVVEVNMITNSASWVLHTGCGAHICNDLQVLQKSRRLTKDEMILRGR